MVHDVATCLLPNGATLVTVHKPGASTSSIAVDWRVGSRFEKPSETGLSHFLEHMVFQGCAGHPSPHAVNVAAELMGSTLDASTSRDQTHFEHRVATNALGKSAELLYALLSEPHLEALDTERSIILEEAMDEFASDGRLIDPDTMSRIALWGRRRLGQPIIGTLARIESYTKADIDRYHGRQYVGANAVVTLVGPQEREELKNIGMRFGSLPVGRRNEVTTAHVTKRQTQVILAPDDRSQCDCRLLFATHGRRHREGRALTILRLALDDGLASRMYERMATQLGLAYEQWALWESYPDVGAFELGAVLSPDKVLQFFTEARGLIESFVKEPPTGAELDRLRFRARWALESALESGSGLIALYGYPHLYGEEALTVDERMNRLFSVTVEELRATADSLLKRPAVAYCTGPVKGLSAAAIRRSLSTGP